MTNTLFARPWLLVLGLVNIVLCLVAAHRWAPVLRPYRPLYLTVAPPPPARPLYDIEEHYFIERQVIEHALADTSDLASSARIVPSLHDGRPNGFKLYAIRPGSLYARFGFQNGDTLLRINGHDLDSPDRCLETYSKLRTSTRFVVEILRRGLVHRLVYDVL
jgi:general secretion pathway protein C